MTSVQNYWNNLTALPATSLYPACYIHSNRLKSYNDVSQSPQKVILKCPTVPHHGYVLPFHPHLLLCLFRLALRQPSWAPWLHEHILDLPYLCLARKLTRLHRGSLNLIKAKRIELPESFCSKITMNQKPQLGNWALPHTFLTFSTISFISCEIPPPSLCYRGKIHKLLQSGAVIKKGGMSLGGRVTYTCVGHIYLIQ